jgi:N-formylglutamate amidohydrolase
MANQTLYPNPFNQTLPEEQRLPVVVSSPHSGANYPKSFLESSRLGNLAIRRSEDFAVDDLIKSAVTFGIPVHSATYPRAFVDVNREPYELDPSMFEGSLPEFANRRSIRVSGGLGTVPRIVAEGQEIYRGKIPVEEAMLRISTVYKPYHSALQNLIALTHVTFGKAVLIDFHSMPSTASMPENSRRPDIVLGDRYATSCDPAVLHFAKSIFNELGYQVMINKPYAGGFITEHYGRPQNGLHAMQIEINRELYMDEVRIVKNSNFDSLSGDLTYFFSQLTELDFDALAGSHPLAAE